MPVGSPQIHNDSLYELMLSTGTQWDAGPFAFALLSSAYTQDDADTEWGDVSANEITDTDYAQVAASSLSLVQSGNKVQLSSGNASFGTSVTIEAKFLVCVAGTAGALNSTDKIIYTVDLDTTTSGSTIAVTGGPFIIRQSQTTGWFEIGQS